MKDPQTMMMAGLAEAVPFKILVKQVAMAIKKYEEQPDDDNSGFLVFTMQIAMMSHLMKDSNTNATDMMTDFEKHQKVMELFKENNN